MWSVSTWHGDTKTKNMFGKKNTISLKKTFFEKHVFPKERNMFLIKTCFHQKHVFTKTCCLK